MGWRPDLTAKVPVNSGRTKKNQRQIENGMIVHTTIVNYSIYNEVSFFNQGQLIDILIEKCANDQSISIKAICKNDK